MKIENWNLKQAEALRTLIWNYENALRDYAYARGLRDGLNKNGRCEINSKRSIIDFAVESDKAEQELFSYLETLEK